MDNAERIFLEITKLGIKKIEAFVYEQQEENLFIEFKQKKSADNPGASPDDKKIYAKALSGFSNASGGVLIWGVDTDNGTGDMPDVAKELKPIKYLRRFLTDLNSLISDAIIPLNTGVVNTLILKNETEDEGFIVTYVPVSEKPPHRAMCKDNKYYTRAGDSFIMMEHYMLEDMFGRRQKPKLNLFYKINSNKENCDFKIVFGIENVGRYLALYPAVRISSLNGLVPYNDTTSGTYSYNLRHTRNMIEKSEDDLYIGGINDALHPNTKIDVSFLIVDNGWKSKDDLIRKRNQEERLIFEYEIFAEGTTSVKERVEITADEIMEKLGFK